MLSMAMTDDERDQDTRDRLRDLQRAERDLLKTCEAHVGNPGRHNLNQHLFVFGAARRLLAQGRGFRHAVNDRNGQVAMSLLRLQLDTVMRLYALYWVRDPEAFASEVLAGGQINRIKDRHGKVMTDKYLRSMLLSRNPWMEPVYDSTSGLIHFSGRHMELVLEADAATGQTAIVIGSNDGDRPLGYYRQVVTAFVHTTMIAGHVVEDGLERLQRDGSIGDLPITGAEDPSTA